MENLLSWLVPNIKSDGIMILNDKDEIISKNQRIEEYFAEFGEPAFIPAIPQSAGTQVEIQVTRLAGTNVRQSLIKHACVKFRLETMEISQIQPLLRLVNIQRLPIPSELLQQAETLLFINEAVPDDLSIVGRFIGGSVGSINQTGKRPCGGGTRAQDKC